MSGILGQTARVLLAATLAVSCGSAWSTDRSKPPPIQVDSYDRVGPAPEDRTEYAARQFGDVRFVMGGGQAMDWLEVYSGNSLIAAYRGFNSRDVHASPDGKYFLVVSSKPLSSLAFAVMDAKGRVIFSAPHREGPQRYCGQAALQRHTWIDEANPDVRFGVEKIPWSESGEEYLQFVAVRGCDGKDVLLGKAAAPAQPRAVQPTRVRGVPGVAALSDEQCSTGEFFIGCTLQNLRGLDPSFGTRTLTLIDGRRAINAQPKSPEPKPVDPDAPAAATQPDP